MNDDTYAASEPRDLTGTPAHETLRAFWGAPAGGNGREGRERESQGDALTNLTNSLIARNARHAADYEARARKAWEIYQAGRDEGVTRQQAADAANLTVKAALGWWRRLGLVTR